MMWLNPWEPRRGGCEPSGAFQLIFKSSSSGAPSGPQLAPHAWSSGHSIKAGRTLMALASIIGAENSLAVHSRLRRKHTQCIYWVTSRCKSPANGRPDRRRRHFKQNNKGMRARARHFLPGGFAYPSLWCAHWVSEWVSDRPWQKTNARTLELAPHYGHAHIEASGAPDWVHLVN